MESLGQYLRTKREEKNLSIDAVNTAIKISVEHINAMESNQLPQLGNYGFARAMVYSYIRYLEADENIGMNLFDVIWPSLNQTDFTPKLPIKEKKVLISVNFIWLISIIIFVVILSSIIWVSYTKGYLKRPFDSLKETPDSIQIKTIENPEKEKLDTLRQRLLELTNTQRNPENQDKKNIATAKKSNGLSDTTDYVNELIFQTDDSPFNSRF